MVEINLNRSLYTEESLLQALVDFRDACDIHLSKGASHFNLRFDLGGDRDPDLPLHFCNYVLGLMKGKAEV